MRADRDPLVAEIRRHNPAHIKLHCGDDVQLVALSAKKNRWEKLLALLDTVPWEFADCLDRDGALLGRVENPNVADDGQGADVDDRKYLANLLVDVMKTTQQQTAAQYNAQMAQFTELARAVVGTVKLTQETYAHAMRVSQQAAAQQALVAQAAGSDDGTDEFTKLMGMMQLMRAASPPAPPAPRPPAPRPPQPPRGGRPEAGQTPPSSARPETASPVDVAKAVA